MIALFMAWYSSCMAAEATSMDGDERLVGELSQEADVDLDQIAERLSWTPRQRLQYLLDMLAFEDKAHRAKPLAD